MYSVERNAAANSARRGRSFRVALLSQLASGRELKTSRRVSRPEDPGRAPGLDGQVTTRYWPPRSEVFGRTFPVCAKKKKNLIKLDTTRSAPKRKTSISTDGTLAPILYPRTRFWQLRKQIVHYLLSFYVLRQEIGTRKSRQSVILYTSFINLIDNNDQVSRKNQIHIDESRTKKKRIKNVKIQTLLYDSQDI